MRTPVAATLCILSAHTSALADASWLSIDARGECVVPADELVGDIDREIAGSRRGELSVAMTFDSGTPVRASVTLSEGGRRVGEAHVEAASCDEARAALTQIAALALSAWPIPDDAVARERPGPPSHAADSAPRVDTPTGSPPRGHGRVSVGAGLGAANRELPNVILVAGAAWAVARGELRLTGRYGLPSTDERDDLERSRVRDDFGSAGVDYCLALDHAGWLSLCGGLELLTRRRQESTELTEAGVNTRSQRSLRFGPNVGLAFVLRQVVAQPQLELSALVPLLGAAPLPGIRAVLGAGMPF